jgi:hypothetical protein
MVLLTIISLFRITIAFCDLCLYGPPNLLLGYLFLKFRPIAQCLFFFVCAASKDALYFFESFTLFIFIQLLPGSASWKPSKESASKHESPTHLRKHVKAGKEGDCFDAKMRIPLACSRKWIASQLLWSRWEHKGQQPFTQQNDKWHLKVETSQGGCILASFPMSIVCSIFSA